MNNEPVAWMTKLYSPDIGEWWDWSDREKEGYTPLYTHPVKDKPHPKCDEACMYLCQMRELTDEEIVILYESSYLQVSGYFDEWEFDPVYFARAILKRAQEK